MGSVSLFPYHSLSIAPELGSENNLKAEIAQGIPHVHLRCPPTRPSHETRLQTQYSWLPDVFRVKDSVSLPLYYACVTLTSNLTSN